MEEPVHVSLLGPIEVRTGDRVAAVIGVKLQALLALLALAAPHVVSDDRLIEELWGADQPSNPTNALQALVSRLRRLVGTDVMVRQEPGYVLRLEPDSVDAVQLEHLVDAAREQSTRGDHAPAAELFHAALQLVRGPPFATLPDSWFARDASARLDQLVLAAHEGLIDAELAMGRHADVLTAILDLVGLHPTRERFRAQLIVALYRSGRQTDALHAYRAARDYLLDELGLDPGPELQRLERSVLAHDPALATPIGLTSTLLPAPSVPVPLTSFVGRQRELEELAAAMESSRLASVVGTAGAGKTRLVLEYTANLAKTSEVWFVELAPLHHPTAVASAVAAAVGAKERQPSEGRLAPTPEERIIERLGARVVVVVLDNCEHVAAAVSACARHLLAGCPRLRLVVTSREPLGIEGERQVVVGPLGDEESAELFVDRARAVQPLFTTSARRGELVDLCRHLDRLPLAIELAAARTKTLPIPEITDRLRDRFLLLRRTQGAATSRHEGLGAAIDWSYELLFDEERRMFCRLAVFTGGATIEAAERVFGRDAFELASRLVGRSLLMADTSGREVRFNMLESLRAYGTERLGEAGELGAARAAHLQWCIEVAERVDRESRRADQLQALTRLDEEHGNVCAALSYAVDHDPAGALRLLAALMLPWWLRGRWQESRQWAEMCLVAGADEAPPLRARVLAYCGLVADAVNLPGLDSTELSRSLVFAEARQREALAIGVASGDEHSTAFAKLLLLVTLTRRASAGEVTDHAEASSLAEDAAEAFDALGDDYGAGVSWATDATLAVAFGEFSHAARSAQRAVPYARRSGDRFAASRIEYVLGILDDVAGDPRSAYRHIERSLRLLDELGSHQAVTAQARILAPLADRCDEPQLAAQWRTFINERDDGWMHFDGTVFAWARNHEGLEARAMGDADRALAAHTQAMEWFAAARIPAALAFTESCLGFLASERSDHATAASHHTAALAAAASVDHSDLLPLALEGCGSTLLNPAETAMLLGAADRMRATSAPSFPPSHRADVASVREATLESLGADDFDVHLAAGATLDRRALLTLAHCARRRSTHEPALM